MNSVKYLSPLALILPLILMSQTTSATKPVYNVCLPGNNYTDDDAFSNNLYQLMFSLATRAPAAAGFALETIGDRGLDSHVNGLALCRGDVNSSVCTTCIRTANAQIRQLCPNKKEAMIWFDECFLHYSNTEFFGQIDIARLFMWNTHNVSDPLAFNSKVKDTMNELKTRASAMPLLFASEEVEISGSSEKLYGLVQCTRDLSSDDCIKCLESATGALPTDGKRGGRVLGGSCSIRYEMYPFFDV